MTAAVFTGQLSIGWSNDLVDLRRDRLVHRADKPLATGALAASRRCDWSAIAVTVARDCVVLSLLWLVRSGLTHLVLGVGSGWAYNLGLKRTVWSWLPYAVAFGTLPAVVWLAARPPDLPPGWLMVAGGVLGVGAHLVNALPDLADDAATGVRGLPAAPARAPDPAAGSVADVASSSLPRRSWSSGPGPVQPPTWAWAALAASRWGWRAPASGGPERLPSGRRSRSRASTC